MTWLCNLVSLPADGRRPRFQLADLHIKSEYLPDTGQNVRARAGFVFGDGADVYSSARQSCVKWK